MEDTHKIWTYYQKLQESLTELIDPGFASQTRSFSLILLNQTYTHTERLFELAEASSELSKGRQAILAKLANHIENTKERGLSEDFLRFISSDLTHCLQVIKERFAREFQLAS